MPELTNESKSIDGVIARVTDEHVRDYVMRLCELSGIPMVDLSEAFLDWDVPRVISSPDEVARAAVDHLAERGFESFGYCGLPGQAYSRHRQQAFTARLEAEGLPCRVYNGRASARSRRPGVALRRLADWLCGFDGPAGILACNDWRAGQVLDAAKLAGLAVPGTIGVLGIDNDAVACETCHVTLSSVDPDAERIGYEAAKRLDVLRRGGSVNPRTLRMGEVRVEARKSTDVLVIDDPIIRSALEAMRRAGTPPRTVAEVLEDLPISRRPFEKRFRAAIGCSPNDELQRCRMRLAQQLLGTTDLPIGSIAERCGYGYAHHLSAAFGRAFGQTPSEYRALSRR
ncbi:MAG: substrate-binding domain-containing protein [Planctomycetota bacterium]